MPCKCSGLKVSHCDCKIVSPCCLRNGEFTNGVVLVANTNSFCNQHSSTKHMNKHNTLMGCIDSIYEKCASFNLRYCPNRGFRKYDHNIKRAIKDLLILVCFLIANFVVLCIILSKTTLHFYFIAADTGQCVWRYLSPKLFASEQTLALTSYTYDYTPHSKVRRIYY